MDYDKEMGPLHGMYGSMEAEFEVQRTVERAELTAFLCLPRKVCGPIKVHVDNKGTIDGLRKGEKECIKPRAGDADLWLIIWEELHELVNRGIVVEVARVKAHRTKKETEKMTNIESFVTKGSEKADELAEAGAMPDQGYGRSESCYCETGERGSVHSLAICSQLPLFSGGQENCEDFRPKPKEKLYFVDRRRERVMHRTEWCAEANKCRCMRCGKGSKYIKMTGRCEDQNSCQKKLGKWRSRHLGGHDLVRRMERQGEVLIWCRMCSGDGHQRIWQTGEKNPISRGRNSPSQRGNELEDRGRKEKNYENGV